jgi:hypothetical protein
LTPSQLFSKSDLYMRQIRDTLYNTNPKIKFKIIPNKSDPDAFDILYFNHEIVTEVYTELTNFEFIIFYSASIPQGMQFSVKKVHVPQGYGK